jgi:hypothetical protein
MGFKKTSDLIAVSFGVTESAANTYTQEEIALQLDVLNNEIFVVLAVDLDPGSPDATAGADSSISCQVTSTSQTGNVQLDNTNCIAHTSKAIRGAGYVDSGVGFTQTGLLTPPANIDYIALIATNNFFVGINGAGNGGAKTVNGRVWGYRARADASTYAALVQSEVLSA